MNASISRKHHGTIHRIREFELEKVNPCEISTLKMPKIPMCVLLIRSHAYRIHKGKPQIGHFHLFFDSCVFFCIVVFLGEFIRWIWHSTNCGRRMVRQNSISRTSGYWYRNGAEGTTETICVIARFLPRISLRPSSGRTQKHCHNVRCGLWNGGILCIHTGICSIGWSNIKCFRHWHRWNQLQTCC